MKDAFERALVERIEQMPSHQELLHYATRAGHRTRPVGCLLACSAVGGDWSRAIDSAVAAEFIHKSSVIRDDIVDDDDLRSGQQAFHLAHGLGAAIGISDVLWSTGLRTIALLPIAVRGACTAAATQTLAEMSSGQLEDLLPTEAASSVTDRLAVAGAKTGSLSDLACRLGAIVGGGDDQQIEALGRYGRDLGCAFQLLNDLRNLRGAEEARLVASDIRKGRDTVLTAFARTNGSPEVRAALLAVASSADPAAIDELCEVVTGSGAVAFVEGTASRLMASARTHLTGLQSSPARDILDSLTRDALLAYAF